MAKEDTIRVPGTTTLLVCVLDKIIRGHLRFAPVKHPGWTFEHDGDYRTPAGGGYHHERSIYICSARVQYKQKCGAGSFVDIRVMAIKNTSTGLPNGDECWILTVWAKTPGTSIGPHVFYYFVDDNSLHLIKTKAELPPPKIDTWWRQLLVVDPNHPYQDPAEISAA